jgi:hypothetical protein
MWQFEYVVQLDGKSETFKYEGSTVSREEIWKRADALGKVLSIQWRILIDGKMFREGNFGRELALHTLEEAVAYLDRTWKKSPTP